MMFDQQCLLKKLLLLLIMTDWESENKSKSFLIIATYVLITTATEILIYET